MQVSAVNQDLGVSKPWRQMFMMRNIPGTPMSYFFRMIVRVVNQKEKTQWPRGARVADAQLVDRYPRQRRMRRDSKAEGKGIQVEGEEEGMGIQVPAVFPIFYDRGLVFLCEVVFVRFIYAV
ncbi:unnamed protein product [Malus baccata var. baccata]